MNREWKIFLAAVVLLPMMGMASGCTASRQAGRQDPDPEIAVRFPLTESPKMNLRSEEPRKTPDEVPPINDETHRPWLKAIEVTVTPGEAGNPEGPAETPGER